MSNRSCAVSLVFIAFNSFMMGLNAATHDWAWMLLPVPIVVVLSWQIVTYRRSA